MKERPLLFYAWPIVTSIRCPSCHSIWEKPSIRCEGESFPPFSRNPESATQSISSYCPACGNQLPPLSELYATGNLELPPVHNKPFIRDFDELKSFFDRTSGHTAQLWNYWVSHSYLAMRIFLENEDVHAFMVCRGTWRVELPRTSFKSSFALSELANSKGLRLEDTASGATIECGEIGIFHDATALW